jgi:hypothetical protein
MKFTVGKKITIRVTSYIIKNVKISSGAVRKLIEFTDKSGNNYVWGVNYNTPFPDEGVKYVSAKIQGIKDTEDGQIIILTGAKDITIEKEEQLARRRAKASAKRAEKNKGGNTTKDGVIPKEEKEVEQSNDLPPTVGGDNPNDTAPAAQVESEETVSKNELNPAEQAAVEGKSGEYVDEKKPESAKPLSWQSFGISDKKSIRINESYIRKMFAAFNDAYFNGDLSLEGARVTAYKSTRNTAGHVTHCILDRTINRGLGPKDIANRQDFLLDRITEFCIGEKNNPPERTEKSWCEVIIHEMIHVYQIQVLKRTGLETKSENSSGHGPTFTVKMKEINDLGGWDISVVDDKVGGIEISQDEINNIQENYYLVKFDSTKRGKRGLERKLSAATLVKKENVSEMVSSISLNYSGIEVFEIHNAESVSSINKFDNKGYQCFTSTIFDELEKRGDITKIDISNIEVPTLENDEIAKNYYMFVGRRNGRVRNNIAYVLVPKEDIDRFKKDWSLNFYYDNKLYNIKNGVPFKYIKPYEFDGAYYSTTTKEFENMKKYLGEEIKMTESIDIKDLKPELRQIYENIFYESNPDVDIFDDYVDENSKVLEIDGQKVLFMKTS